MDGIGSDVAAHALPSLRVRQRYDPDVPEDVAVALLHLNDPNWDFHGHDDASSFGGTEFDDASTFEPITGVTTYPNRTHPDRTTYTDRSTYPTIELDAVSAFTEFDDADYEEGDRKSRVSIMDGSRSGNVREKLVRRVEAMQRQAR